MYPYFSVIYIMTTTSILSTGIKHLVPVILGRFTAKSSVTVSGGNPLIVFLLRAVTYFVGLNLALNELNIELLGLFASLAVFSLIIGLAVQQTLGNIVNSFMLAVDRPFEVGDRIEVEGMIGTVISMGILSTKILDRDEKLVVIPNNSLISSTLVNHARGGGDGLARRISVVVDIGVDYRESIDHVKVTMLKLARDCPYTIDSPEPRVLLVELGDFAKVLRLYTWVADYSDEWVTRDWLLKSLDERFEEEHIRIPFPTAVELSGEDDEMLTGDARSKESRQRAAKRQMTHEDRNLRKQRDDAREELEGIQEMLRDTGISKDDRAELDNRAIELSKTLTMFDTDDD
jgi:small-conductance mechanosensitive channel